jgi:hypothetical protein
LFNIPTTSAGITASSVQQNIYTAYADTGSPNAYAITATPAPTVISGSAFAVLIKAGNTSTGAATLSVNGTVTAIRKKTPTGLAVIGANDLIAGQWYDFRYDGTYWQVSPSTSSGSGGSGVLPISGSESAAPAAPASGTLTAYAATNGALQTIDGSSVHSSTVINYTCPTNQWTTTIVNGVYGCSQPSSLQLSDVATNLGGISNIASLLTTGIYANRFWFVTNGTTPTDITTGTGNFFNVLQGNSGGTAWVPQVLSYGVNAIVGDSAIPTRTNNTGTVAIVTGSTNVAGTLTSSTTGAINFTLTWSLIAYPHRAVCFFTDETTPSDFVTTVSATTGGLTAAGTVTTGDVISYACPAGY